MNYEKVSTIHLIWTRGSNKKEYTIKAKYILYTKKQKEIHKKNKKWLFMTMWKVTVGKYATWKLIIFSPTSLKQCVSTPFSTSASEGKGIKVLNYSSWAFMTNK